MSANSALLAQIQQGKRLKKAETNDRSAPAIDGASKKPSSGGGGGGVNRGGGGAPSAPVPGAGGAPQLGALFAGGIPKLKPAGQPAPIGRLFSEYFFLTHPHTLSIERLIRKTTHHSQAWWH